MLLLRINPTNHLIHLLCRTRGRVQLDDLYASLFDRCHCPQLWLDRQRHHRVPGSVLHEDAGQDGASILFGCCSRTGYGHLPVQDIIYELTSENWEDAFVKVHKREVGTPATVNRCITMYTNYQIIPSLFPWMHLQAGNVNDWKLITLDYSLK